MTEASTSTIFDKSTNSTKLYSCKNEVIRQFAEKLLEYVNNKNDYNFLVLTRKIKYIYTNVPYLYFDIFK